MASEEIREFFLLLLVPVRGRKKISGSFQNPETAIIGMSSNHMETFMDFRLLEMKRAQH